MAAADALSAWHAASSKQFKDWSYCAGLLEKAVSTADGSAAAQLNGQPQHAESRLGTTCRYVAIISCMPSHRQASMV